MLIKRIEFNDGLDASKVVRIYLFGILIYKNMITTKGWDRIKNSKWHLFNFH